MFAAEFPPNKLVKVTIIVNGISFYLNMKIKDAQILHSKLLSILTYFTLHRPVMISALYLEEIVWNFKCQYGVCVFFIKLTVFTHLTQTGKITIHLVILIQSCNI